MSLPSEQAHYLDTGVENGVKLACSEVRDTATSLSRLLPAYLMRV